MTTPGSLFEAIGGTATVDRLVTTFYKHVGTHQALIPIFPEDLTEVARKQALFLTQFLGGPSLYSEERGHPRLRRRHLPFEITFERKEAWVECMEKAFIETKIEEPYFSAILEKLAMTANHMMNSPE